MSELSPEGRPRVYHYPHYITLTDLAPGCRDFGHRSINDAIIVYSLRSSIQTLVCSGKVLRNRDLLFEDLLVGLLILLCCAGGLDRHRHHGRARGGTRVSVSCRGQRVKEDISKGQSVSPKTVSRVEEHDGQMR